MGKSSIVFTEVSRLYSSAATSMGAWMWRHHTQWVADKAVQLAEKYGANKEKTYCAALLHDLGDSYYERDHPEFDSWSWETGKMILKQAGFRKNERDEIMEAIRTHSCHPQHLPTALEGKILATADGMWHLQTNFFPVICYMNRPDMTHTYEEWQAWFDGKIERDFNHKIFFEDEKAQVKKDYEALKRVFSLATLPGKLSCFKAAIFDMDGTMINNAAYHKKAWQEFLHQHGVTLTEEEFRQKVAGKKNDQILELIFGKKLNKNESQQYANEKEALYRKLFKPHIAEINGLTALVEALHTQGIKTAIATTAPPKNRDFALKALGLEGKFEVILGEEHTSRGKPHPEIYQSTAKMLGVAPSECLVFEDSPVGVAAGKGAGMTVVAILSSHAKDELQAADYLVDDFTCLPSLQFLPGQ